ncbi:MULTISPECIES: DUF998 domain-containing protein [unclassified Cryobacterium]|uniref:DUF998 domain-containing protein n=1 Tax=unclassified Cryobacterium TaxID=2649013 RepID=UPI001444CE8D
MSRATSLSRVIQNPIADAEARESSALLVGAVVFVAGTIPALFVFWGRDLPISGRGSVGEFAAIGSGIAALLAVLYASLLRSAQQRDTRTWRRLRWFDVAAICAAHAVIALLGWIGLASVFSASFQGAEVYGTSAAVLAGVIMAITAYAAFLSAINLTPMLLSLLLAVFLAVGTLASMLSASDPLWWKENLSTLGINDDISALAFNLTLIIAGVMVTTISHYATAWLPTATQAEARGRYLVRLALILIGILLACVGIFTLDEFFAIHGLTASGMALIYVAMVIALPWLVPSMPRVFVLLGYVFVGVIVVLAIFYVTGYYTLTAVELIAFVLIFAWLIVFLRTAGSVEPKVELNAE